LREGEGSGGGRARREEGRSDTRKIIRFHPLHVGPQLFLVVLHLLLKKIYGIHVIPFSKNGKLVFWAHGSFVEFIVSEVERDLGLHSFVQDGVDVLEVVHEVGGNDL
jgi:hypothetical protein